MKNREKIATAQVQVNHILTIVCIGYIPGGRKEARPCLAAPAGMPDDVTPADALADSVTDADVAAHPARNGADAMNTTPEEFRTLIAEELGNYGEIVADMD